MVRVFWRWALAAAVSGALLGCTRIAVQPKQPPPDPLLVTRKPIEGKPRPQDAELSARLQPPSPPSPPSPAGDWAASPPHETQAPVRPVQLWAEPVNK